MNLKEQLEARLGLDVGNHTLFTLFNPNGNSFKGGGDFLRDLRKGGNEVDLLTMLKDENTRLGLLYDSRWFSFKNMQRTYDIINIINPADFTVKLNEEDKIIFGVPPELVSEPDVIQIKDFNDLNSRALDEIRRGVTYSILRKKLFIPDEYRVRYT
ncbi:MAG: hypothetical protein LAT82_04700 [Nanoarchaeota archaeon]|nr:hypothetical protein [Nanoarchaeota archaeon]